MTRKTVTFVGEGMLELTARADGGSAGWALGYGGDTLNTAIHMARAGHKVAFASAIGNDPFSASLREQWGKEGLDLSLLLSSDRLATGLYAISVDDAGERSFVYWRDNSAARQVFALPDSAGMIEQAARSDLLAFSLISLAVLPAEGRDTLLRLAERVRAAGGIVAFDGNYRARLWPSKQDALTMRDRAIAIATIGLPTLDDEIAMAGPQDAADVARHWRALGCEETVVKLGADGCRLPDGAIVPPGLRLTPVDTSGAGDAFNAGYLGARIEGATCEESARHGHALAGWTVMRRGAIPARDCDAPYDVTTGTATDA